ncbi:MAG: outer membrane protein assembly factor BamA [Chitinispirillaceae bacterium]|nr:outer membrane protein assembly factor BamA [Chitinispirillaceae bacterium]
MSVLLCSFSEAAVDSAASAVAPDTAGRAAGALDVLTNPEALDSLAAPDGADGDETAAVLRSKILDSLAITGCVLNSKSIVYNNIFLRKREPFTMTDVKESIRKLAGLNLFRSIDVLVAREDDSSASLVIRVEEYPFCESIEYAGLKKIKQKDLEEKFPVKVRQMVTDNQVFLAEQHIKKQYEKKGYLLAEITTERIDSKVPGNVILKFSVREGPRVQVKNVTFKGNHEVKEKKLKSKLKTKEDRWWRSGDYEENLFREHLDTLIMFYNELGFLDAAIVKDSVWYLESKKELAIEITVEEGRKFYAGKFDFTGNTVIPADSLASKILLKEGKPFQKSRYDMSKYFVENAYREEGYLWVALDEQKRFRGDTIDVTFGIYEGKAAVVRKIDITGNTKTREKVIRREIDLLPGQRYRQSLMASSRQRVFSLNYFSDVKPDLTPNSDGTIDMVFEVTEKDNIGQFQVGAAYSQLDGFMGTCALSIPNFRGAGQELKIDLQAGTRRQAIDLGFTEPWAFNSPTSLSGRVFYNRSQPYYYYGDTAIWKSYGFEVGAGRSKLAWPDNRFSVSGRYHFSFDQTTYKLGSAGNVVIPGKGFMSKFSLTISRYDLDMPQFPSSGNLLSITPQIAGLGGDFRYLKGMVDYSHYFPLPLKLSLGSKSTVGLIAPFLGDSIIISRFDLFKTGGVMGDANLRGYREYSIGGFGGSPDQGLAIFASSLELRYPLLPQQLYLLAFADAGEVWSGLNRVDLGNLKKGAGFGLRLNIPMMGMMGFDFGFPLTDPSGNLFDPGRKKWEVHFLMGNMAMQ